MQFSPVPSASSRVSGGTKFVWGLTGIADTFLTYGLASLVMPIYNIGYGVNAIWLGYALALPRLIDMLIDPLMGVISDNTRTRWGRRRPYLFVGGVLAAVVFPLVWIPPFSGENAILAWFVGSMIVMSLVYTVFAIPCMALGFELTSDYDEKTRVMAWRLYLSVIAGFTVQWLYKLLVLEPFGGSEADGIRYIGPVIGLIILATALPAAVVCRERIQKTGQPQVRFLDAIRLTLRNRAFLILMAGYVILITAMNTVGSLGLYVNIFYVCGGDKPLAGTIGGWFGTVMIASAMLSMWLIAKISQWSSKRVGVQIGLGLAIAGNLSLWWTMNPEHPYLQLFSAALLGLGIQGCWLMIDSMAADACDDDEVRTGMRREGVYSAAKGFCMKAALTVTAISAGYTLAFAGYREGFAPSLDVAVRMKILLIAVQVAGLGLGMLLFWYYPLTRAKAEENKRILDARAVSAPPLLA
jgi:GPH family glycoside/pentoside/hexuronide:cation symporter